MLAARHDDDDDDDDDDDYIPDPSATSENRPKINFLQLCTTDLNSKVFFLTGCHTKVKEQSLSYN